MPCCFPFGLRSSSYDPTRRESRRTSDSALLRVRSKEALLSKLAGIARPNRVRHPTDWSFTSCCSPPRLTATQLPLVTGPESDKPEEDLTSQTSGSGDGVAFQPRIKVALNSSLFHRGWKAAPTEITPGLDLQYLFLMAMAVALQVNGHRQAADMGGVCFNVYIQCGNFATQPLGSDPKLVNFFQQLFFKLGDLGV